MEAPTKGKYAWCIFLFAGILLFITAPIVWISDRWWYVSIGMILFGCWTIWLVLSLDPLGKGWKIPPQSYILIIISYVII
jgi:hypothetical protein